LLTGTNKLLVNYFQTKSDPSFLSQPNIDLHIIKGRATLNICRYLYSDENFG